MAGLQVKECLRCPFRDVDGGSNYTRVMCSRDGRDLRRRDDNHIPIECVLRDDDVVVSLKEQS